MIGAPGGKYILGVRGVVYMSPPQRRNRNLTRLGLSAAAIAVTLLVATGAFVSAANQTSGGYMFFARDDKLDNDANNEHVKISGNFNIYQGNIKSNGDLH